MSTIVTRSGKGTALTHTEVDANFTNLNADKAEASAVILATEKGAASGVCPLDATSKVASTYLPSYVDDVLEYANLAALPVTGETGKIYVALDTNKTYRWSGSAYIYITSGAVDSVAGKTGVVTLTSADVGLGNVTNNAAVANLSGTNTGDQTLPTTLPASDVYAWAKEATKPTYTATEVSLGNASNTSDANKPISTATQTALDLKSPLASPTFTGTVSGITKAMVSLGNVDNTTDANKPVSTATQTALDLKSPLASPTFTGTVNTANLAYTGTLTGGTGILNIGSGQVYKDASGNVAIGSNAAYDKLDVFGGTTIRGNLAVTAAAGISADFTSSAGGYQPITNGNGTSSISLSTNGSSTELRTTTNSPQLFYTNNTERMRINSSGNVGIGTSSPSGKLEVVSSADRIFKVTGGTDTPAQISSTVANCYMQISGSVADLYLGNVSGAATITTGGSERMRINSSGNVGIGTSVNSVYDGVAQPRPLVVQSASTATGQYNSTNALVICNSDTTTNNASQLNFAAITGASTNQYTSAVISCIYGARTNTIYPTGTLTFATSPATQAPVERMRINSSGNVLVTNPAGLGYGAGSGGTVTQATDKSTGVTLNKPSGRITMVNTSLAANTNVFFILTNSTISTGDLVLVNILDNAAPKSYQACAEYSRPGYVSIMLRNTTGASLSEDVVLTFAVIKGANS